MIIAQSVLPSGTENSQRNSDPSAIGFWWILPLAIVVFGAAWYIRQKKKNSGPKSSSKTHKQPVASTNLADASQIREESTDANPTIRRSSSLSQAAKKKNKVQSKNERRMKHVLQRDSASLEQKNSKVIKPKTSIVAQSPDRAEANAQAKPVTVPVPTPVNAIFEPLFNVVQHRRKTTATLPTVLSQTNPSIVSTQPSGGKFERNVVTAAATRSIASRWPTSATQQKETLEIETTNRQILSQTDPSSSPPTELSRATVPSQPSTTVLAPSEAPAKGLKSFVSKVRSTNATNSDDDRS